MSSSQFTFNDVNNTFSKAYFLFVLLVVFIYYLSFFFPSSYFFLLIYFFLFFFSFYFPLVVVSSSLSSKDSSKLCSKMKDQIKHLLLFVSMEEYGKIKLILACKHQNKGIYCARVQFSHSLSSDLSFCAHHACLIKDPMNTIKQISSLEKFSCFSY